MFIVFAILAFPFFLLHLVGLVLQYPYKLITDFINKVCSPFG